MGRMMILFICWMVGWFIVTVVVVNFLKNKEDLEDLPISDGVNVDQ